MNAKESGISVIDINPPSDTEGRPRVVVLTEAQMEELAERAAKKVFATIYAEVGKGVLRKLTWAVGFIVTGLLVWLAGQGALSK